MNALLTYATTRLRDELVKTAAVSFVSASSAAAGQFAIHWAVNRWQSTQEKNSSASEKEIEQTAQDE
jgi:hypothetical protein